jgi:ubiquitin-protein ligase
LDILLAGPTSTPYETGVFKLHLTIPTTYPNEPPKAYFRTIPFHPNVDDKTGAVCVETLKRDWDSKLTLRHVLITISCLLVQPNASSALNADAGMLLEQGDWEAFEKRARLMTRLQAAVPRELKEAVQEAQTRGEETPASRDMMAPPPPRSVQTAPKVPPTTRPFVLQSVRDDVFGDIRLPPPHASRIALDKAEHDAISSADEKADTVMSPAMASIPRFSPRRQAPATRLSQWSMSDDEAEYPPSPKKSPQKQKPRDPSNVSMDYPPSPRKSPQKKRLDNPLHQQPVTANPDSFSNFAAESSRTGAQRQLQFTSQSTIASQDYNNTPTILDSSSFSITTANATFDLGTAGTPAIDMSDVEASFDLPKRTSAVAAQRRLAAANTQQQQPQQARTLRRRPNLRQEQHEEESTPISIPASVPRLGRLRRAAPPPQSAPPALSPPRVPITHTNTKATRPQQQHDKVRKSASTSRANKEMMEMEKKLWKLCGENVQAWNRGDFGGFFNVKAARW